MPVSVIGYGYIKRELKTANVTFCKRYACLPVGRGFVTVTLTDWYESAFSSIANAFAKSPEDDYFNQ